MNKNIKKMFDPEEKKFFKKKRNETAIHELRLIK
jgi:hypothetical protein